MADQSKAEYLASQFPGTFSSSTQMSHRLQLVSFWSIAPGSRVLELGCGQGDCTVALADAVGPEGHVDAVDPGAPDYGSPYTLSQSQSHISTGPLGPRITWHLATDPLSFLADLPQETTYDAIVLSHCIYYFASPAILTTLLTAIKPFSRNLYMAEWSLRATTPATLPHVLTVLLLSSLEAKREDEGNGNVRTVLSPRQIIEKAGEVGWKRARGAFKETDRQMQDGYWEVNDVLRKREKVLAEMKANGVSEQEMVVLEATYDTIELSTSSMEGGVAGTRTMDYWVCVFENEEM